jgi:hypothetical protein
LTSTCRLLADKIFLLEHLALAGYLKSPGYPGFFLPGISNLRQAGYFETNIKAAIVGTSGSMS